MLRITVARLAPMMETLVRTQDELDPFFFFCTLLREAAIDIDSVVHANAIRRRLLHVLWSLAASMAGSARLPAYDESKSHQ